MAAGKSALPSGTPLDSGEEAETAMPFLSFSDRNSLYTVPTRDCYEVQETAVKATPFHSLLKENQQEPANRGLPGCSLRVCGRA